MMNKKRILVTGGAGFIGSNLVKRLLALEAEVSVLVKYNSIIDNVRLSSVWDQVNVIEADLRNVDSLIKLESGSFDIIFHLAAYNHVSDSFLHVNEALMSNGVATANLLEHGPDYKRFVYISTSEVYGYQTEVPFKESFVPFPISPYSIGKYAGELYSRMKHHETKKSIICLRPFNAFGPYQSDRAVLPELIIKCLLGRPIETTEGIQTREFNYVSNLVDAFVAAGESDVIPDGPINIGSNNPIAIRDLVRKIHKLSNSNSKLYIGKLPNRPTEIWEMCSDYSQANDVLDWSPKVGFEEGLGLTIDWFRKYVDLYFSSKSKLNLL
jgi:UDP-glucose 4-epimerase